MTSALRTLLTPIALIAASPVVMAQLIDNVQLQRVGNDAVLSIQLTTPIQYQRTTKSRAGDLGQAFYSVLPTREAINLIGSQRSVPGAGAIPDIIVTDVSDDRRNLQRKLIVRLSRAVPFAVRPGKGNQVIELVFGGLGDSVRLATVESPAAAMAPPQDFIVTLQSSPDPGHMLEGSVPAALQQYQTFTSTRTVDGKTVHDISIGYFNNRGQAQSALKLLQPRFPGATIVSLKAPSGSASGPKHAAGEIEAQALSLLTEAQTAIARNEPAAAMDALGKLLNLPPNTQSRTAQEMIGGVRLKMGEIERARAEFEAFLNLYPSGADSDRVRAQLAGLPPKPPEAVAAPTKAPESNWSGSLSTFYFGGKSQIRDQTFEDSPVGGLPVLVNEGTISDTDQGQVQTSVDLNWRKRTQESDSRFVLREAYTVNLKPGKANRNRLSALYFDNKSLANGTSFRVGRQSPIGGGVLYRFDGVQGGYTFSPKWRINAVAGVPSDDLLDSRRRLYGTWIDAEALTPHLSGSLYFNQGTIDGEVDRRAVGSELRYFDGGISVSSQLDYDLVLKGVNIASLQGTWQLPDTTVYNLLIDRRQVPILSLGNALFFQDPNLPQVRRLQDLLATSTVAQLRDRVKAVTATQKQFLFGATTPLNDTWQVGGDLGMTNVSAVAPVAIILPQGQASTGNVWSLTGQLIGSNLYSKSDTHVFVTTLLKGPTYRGLQLAYNNMTSFENGWRLEPSLKFYRQSDDAGTDLTRWTPGLRVSYRIKRSGTLESELSYEKTKRTGLLSNENSDRLFYYLGARYDF
jgi:tetratricopeptide (TPR) repeat protein